MATNENMFKQIQGTYKETIVGIISGPYLKENDSNTVKQKTC